MVIFDGFIIFFILFIEIYDKYYIVFFCVEIEIFYINLLNEFLEN